MPEKKRSGSKKAPARKAAPRKKEGQQGEQGQESVQAHPIAARKPDAAAAASAGLPRLLVKQVKSGIGHADTYRRTLRALGLRHYQAVVTVSDNPTMRGMLHKVRHLVRVTPEGA